MRIWIDADACPAPVKDIVFRASERRGVRVCLVANRNMHVPQSDLVEKVIVARGADVADKHIKEHVEPPDIVITADIPLAADIVEQGAVAIDPRGEVYTRDNVTERLSVRNFMDDMRGTGLATGGPAGLSRSDIRRFANGFDRLLTERLQQR